MTWLVLAQVLGGVVLFLLGMQWLSLALRAAAGERLRVLLTAATASRARGLLLGTSVGFLAHSSAATVMTVGFVHAGLLKLAAALPVMIGANIGTTLSMQLISLRLSDYALAAIAVGGALNLAAGEGRWKLTGRAILGAGLLFFGMQLSGDAIAPYRAELAPVLATIDGSSLAGLLLGVAISAVVTGIVQSSGAVIGMAFVLARSEAFTSLEQTYPIVLGAHIGTTVTALLASIGTSAEARRAALANTIFNVFNATLGVVAASVFVPLLKQTSGDLVHQTANTHTAIMVVAAMMALPLTAPGVAVMRRLIRSAEPERPGSFLDLRLLCTPEDALVATLRELGRCTELCRESFGIVVGVIHAPNSSRLRRVARNEASINEIKVSVRDFLRRLARGYLSRRQALMAQALNRCVVELERVGDHIHNFAGLVREEGGSVFAQLDERTAAEVLRLARLAEKTVVLLVRSFDSHHDSFDAPSWEVLEARNAFVRESAPVRSEVNERLSRHEVPARMALAFSDYVVALERIVRHCAVIAQEQRQPMFFLKRSKLGRLAGPHAPSAPE